MIKYELLILLRKAKWFYIEYFEAVMAIAISAIVLLMAMAVSMYLY